jgi:hypothetical protein
MKSQAQIRRPGQRAERRERARRPSEAEIPEARVVLEGCTRVGGPQGRSRMNQVAAA